LGCYAVELGVWSPSDHRRLRLGPWWRPARKGVLLRLEAALDRLAARAPQ
jgi:hypothetical protein